MMLQPDETERAPLQHVISLLRSLLQAPAPILSNFFRNIDYRFVSFDAPVSRLTSSQTRYFVAKLAHAVPEILYFLPVDSIPRFVFLLSSIQVLSRDDDPMLDVRVDLQELNGRLSPLLLGLKRAMLNAGFPPSVIRSHIDLILEQLNVPLADRGPFFP